MSDTSSLPDKVEARVWNLFEQYLAQIDAIDAAELRQAWDDGVVSARPR